MVLYIICIGLAILEFPSILLDLMDNHPIGFYDILYFIFTKIYGENLDFDQISKCDYTKRNKYYTIIITP